MLDEGFNQKLSAKWAAEHAADNAAYKAELAARPAAGAVPTNAFTTPSGKAVQWRYIK
jgi:hypothetical protein